MPEPAHNRRTARSRWSMLAILTALMTFGSVIRYFLAPLGPSMMEDLQIGTSGLGILSGSLVLLAAFLSVWVGVLVERFGQRSMSLVGSLAMGVPFLLFVWPLSFWTIAVLVSIAGLGYSFLILVSNGGVVDWFPRNERGLAMGIKQSGVPLGIVLAAALMPGMAQQIGWRHTVVVWGVLMIVIGIVSYIWYRPGPLVAPPDPASVRQAGSFRTSVAVLKDPHMLSLYLIGGSCMMMQACVITFMLPFLQEAYRIGDVQGGLFLSMSQVLGMVARPVTGVVSDRLFLGRRKQPLVLIALLAAVTFATLAFGEALIPRPLLPVWVGLIGVASVAWNGLYLLLSVETPSRAQLGAASGLTVTTVMVASLVAPPVFGYLVERFSFITAMLSISVWLTLAGIVFMVVFRERLQRDAGMEA